MPTYIEERPWGRFEVLIDDELLKVKRITVNPGARLSYQRHQRRSEHWFVVEGAAVVTLEGEEIAVPQGLAIDIPAKSAHRVTNREESPLVFVEIQTGDYFWRGRYRTARRRLRTDRRVVPARGKQAGKKINKAPAPFFVESKPDLSDNLAVYCVGTSNHQLIWQILRSSTVHIETREKGGAIVLNLFGSIRTNEDYAQFKAAIDGAISNGQAKLVLNFKDVNFINSSGLGRLVLAAKRAESNQGSIKISNLSDDLRELFTFTRLDAKIPVFDSEEEAVQSFG